MTRIIKIEHDGYHGHHSATLRVCGEPGAWYTLTDRQAHKLRDIACGMDDCRCGETLLSACEICGSDNLSGMPIYRIQIPEVGEDIEVSGNYPS